MPIDPNVPVIWQSPASGSGAVTPRAMPSPVFSRPQQAPLPTPTRAPETPGFRAAVAGEETRARKVAEAEAQELLSAEGRAKFTKAVNFLKQKYNALHSRGEMISSKLPWYENLSNAAEAQLVQLVGNPTGSQNQSDRETIINQRNILIPLLMQATGANSRMIDSNSEAQRFLSAVTSPSQSYETVMDSLNNVEALFGAAVSSLRNQTRPEPLLPRGSKVDDLVNKYLKK